MSKDDEAWMRMALEQARAAANLGEVPVGAIVVVEGRVVGAGANAREHKQDPTAHAEILAIRQAAANLGGWRLVDATVYVTLEPCPMCAGALVNARVRRLVFGAEDPKAGAVRTLYQIADDVRLNHRMDVAGGILADASSGLLRTFFQGRRSG